MTRTLRILTGFAMALSATAFATPSRNLIDTAKIRTLVNEHLVNAAATRTFDDCPTNSGPCVDSVCEHLGTWGCDTQDEVIPVVRACRGNFGRACVDEACTRLGTWGCDTPDEALPLAEACRGAGGGCVAEVCNRLGTWGCDERAEVLPVINACQDQIDGTCVAAVCDRLGQWGCDTADEALAVARECGGH